VDLKDPVSNATAFIEIAHRFRIFRCYARQGLFTGNMRMGELADQVTGDFPAEDPACIVGTLLCERIKLRAGDVGMSVIVMLGRCPWRAADTARSRAILIGHIALVAQTVAAIVLAGGWGAHGNSESVSATARNHVDFSHSILSKRPLTYVTG
jgi:hypothetical protein